MIDQNECCITTMEQNIKVVELYIQSQKSVEKIPKKLKEAHIEFTKTLASCAISCLMAIKFQVEIISVKESETINLKAEY